MIKYTRNGFRRVFQITGSVFPSAMLIGVPCAIISALIRVGIQHGVLPMFEDEDSIIRETQAFSGFSVLVGFLVIFRTSQAYGRFWEGSSSLHRMQAEWFDAAASLVAFSQHSEAFQRVSDFNNLIVRLFSLLHACALAELEIINCNLDPKDINGPTSYLFDVVDPASLTSATMETLGASACKVELLFTWIQILIVKELKQGVLTVPPPLLSRSFQELANGMVAFRAAINVAYIPFPFPYAQTCDVLLIVHWIVIPFIMAHWVSHPAWAGVFTLLQVFILWALNFIATEIENPFGSDDNDLDGDRMQDEMNRQLVMLMQPGTIDGPQLVAGSIRLETESASTDIPTGSMKSLWASSSPDVSAKELFLAQNLRMRNKASQWDAGCAHAPTSLQILQVNRRLSRRIAGRETFRIPRTGVDSKRSSGNEKTTVGPQMTDAESGWEIGSNFDAGHGTSCEETVGFASGQPCVFPIASTASVAVLQSHLELGNGARVTSASVPLSQANALMYNEEVTGTGPLEVGVGNEPQRVDLDSPHIADEKAVTAGSARAVGDQRDRGPA